MSQSCQVKYLSYHHTREFKIVSTAPPMYCKNRNKQLGPDNHDE